MSAFQRSTDRPKILLIGYYGRGNFGDDVLLKVTHGLLKNAMPHARISVIVDGDGGEYVRRMLGDIEVLKPGRHGHFDMIVHGGGGVFFDFETHGTRARLIERVTQWIGWDLFITFEELVRLITHKPRTSADCRLGFGIGVGSFSPGSPALRAGMPILGDFDALWLRDPKSVENLQRFGSVIGAKLIEGSDLAFLTEYWLAPEMLEKPFTVRPRLGVALRDWPEDRGGIAEEELRLTLASLAETYDITGFIFDREADPILQRVLAPYPTHVWQPQRMKIADFAGHIAAQEVMLTSRAHGAICSACLGVPTVIVNIEPKLEQVAAMLPHSSILIEPHHIARCGAAIAQARLIPAETVMADVSKNHRASAAALASMQGWFL